MSALMTKAAISIGDLLIGYADTYGEIVYDTIQGWHSGAGSRVELEKRVASDGAHDPGKTLREPRVVTITGWIAGSTRGQTSDLIHQLRSLFSDGRSQLMTVADPDHGSLSATVVQSGGTEVAIDWDGDTFATWQLSVTAPDPRLYGPDRIRSVSLPGRGDAPGLLEPLAEPLADGWNPSLSGEVVVENPGTAAFWPRLRIVGPAANPRIWSPDTGSELWLRLTVPAGQFVDVLCKDRRVLAQGVASRRYAVSYTGDWLAIPAGGASLRWEADIYEPDAQLFVWAPEGAWL